MALRLLYLLFCQVLRWLALLARSAAAKYAELLPGGRLVFLTNSVLASLCLPEVEGFTQERLVRPQRMLHRLEWPGGIEFHPSHGDWICVLGVNGFVVEAPHELYAPAGAPTNAYYDIATASGPAGGRWMTSRPPSSGGTGQADWMSVFALQPVDPARECDVFMGPTAPNAGNRDPDRT
jgi:hypothetical protein